MVPTQGGGEIVPADAACFIYPLIGEIILAVKERIIKPVIFTEFPIQLKIKVKQV